MLLISDVLWAGLGRKMGNRARWDLGKCPERGHQTKIGDPGAAQESHCERWFERSSIQAAAHRSLLSYHSVKMPDGRAASIKYSHDSHHNLAPEVAPHIGLTSQVPKKDDLAFQTSEHWDVWMCMSWKQWSINHQFSFLFPVLSLILSHSLQYSQINLWPPVSSLRLSSVRCVLF